MRNLQNTLEKIGSDTKITAKSVGLRYAGVSEKGFYRIKNGATFIYKDEKDFGSFKTLLEGNYLPAMSAVIKLEQIKEVDAWTSGNTIEDWEMWLKLSKKYKFAYVDKSVALAF